MIKGFLEEKDMAYNVKMIRDFIERLQWSLRVQHFELTAGPDALHPELLEQVGRFWRKRGVPRLLSLFALRRDRPELTEEQMGDAMRRFAAYMAQVRGDQLRHLEALKELLDEAYFYATGRMSRNHGPRLQGDGRLLVHGPGG
jgi:hypothetical protein